MIVTCTIVDWHEASDLPDADTTVLVHCLAGDEPVWVGYFDGETWRSTDGDDLEDSVVLHWAHLPEPPGGGR